MDREIEKSREQALTVVSLSTAALVVFFSVAFAMLPP
jgi:hypothetical protein